MARACRNWCFTINDEETVTAWKAPRVLPDIVSYAVWQQEQGEKTQHEHIQGYAEVKKPMRMKQFKETLGIRGAHIEMRQGTRDQARNYCMKADTRINGPWEHGTWSEVSQGKRTDLDEVARLAEKGAGIEEIASLYPTQWIKFNRGITSLVAMQSRQKSACGNRDRTKIVLWGNPGVGKTRWIFEVADAPSVYKINPDDGALWWDGYDGQKIVLIDDFDGSSISYRKLLDIMDIYQIRLPIKGGFTYANWDTLVITTNIDPARWYPAHDYEPLRRRIDHLITNEEIVNFYD